MHSSCSPFHLLCIYCFPSKFVSRLSPLSVNHAGPRRKPMSNFIFQNTQRTGRRRKRSRRWMSLRLPSRESYWTRVTTPSLTTDPCSLLAVTVLTAFCAVYCKYPSFFFVWRRAMTSCLLLSVVDSIEGFAEHYSAPKPFIGLILLPTVVSEYQNLFYCQVKLSFQSRQMQLDMSLLYRWLWKIEWSLRSPSALEARLWVFFQACASEPHLHKSLC